MAFINNEIPSWAINWVNKVFTLANPIYQMDDVFVDWAVYFAFTVTDTYEITLVDAPTVSIVVDYYDTPPTNPTSWKLLVSDMLTIFKRSKNSSLVDVTDEVFLDFANDLNIDYYDLYVDANPWDYITATSYSVTSSNFSTALPTDLQEISGVYEVDSNWLQTVEVPPIHITWNNWYYTEWGNIIVRWLPNKTIEVRYFEEPLWLSVISEATLIDNKRRNYPIVRNLLDLLYQWWINNNSWEVKASEKYIQDIWKLILNTTKDSTNPDLNYNIY